MAECDNCGCQIGKLESPREWNSHQVCDACYDRLARKSPADRPIEFADPDANYRTTGTLIRVFFWIGATIVVIYLITKIYQANNVGG